MKIKQIIIKEKRFILLILVWIIAILGYILLWWYVLPVTILTGMILLGLLMGIPTLIIGFIKKLESGFYLLALVVGLIILFSSSALPNQNRNHQWRASNTVLAYERALAFNHSQLESRIEDRPIYRSYARFWDRGGYVSLTVMTRPNYRFTEEQLEELGRIAQEIGNLYKDARFPTPWEADDFIRIWIQYPLDGYWLRTYPTESTPLTMTREAGLSTIYGVEENIAVIEVRFLRELSWLVLRLPLIDQHGDFQGENFELALQLQQLMLAEILDGAEETRPFERAREVLSKLEGRGYE